MNIAEVIGNKAEQAAGVWIPYPESKGVEFKLCFMGNPDFQDFYAGRIMKARKGVKNVPPDRDRAITNIGLRKFIVKDWRGLTTTDEQGQEIEWPFNDANCKKLLEESILLRSFIVVSANDIENFGGGDKADLDDEDETEGSVTTPQDGLKSGAPVAS